MYLSNNVQDAANGFRRQRPQNVFLNSYEKGSFHALKFRLEEVINYGIQYAR